MKRTPSVSARFVMETADSIRMSHTSVAVKRLNHRGIVEMRQGCYLYGPTNADPFHEFLFQRSLNIFKPVFNRFTVINIVIIHETLFVFT